MCVLDRFTKVFFVKCKHIWDLSAMEKYPPEVMGRMTQIDINIGMVKET